MKGKDLIRYICYHEAFDKDIVIGVQGYVNEEEDIHLEVFGDKCWLTDSCAYEGEKIRRAV